MLRPRISSETVEFGYLNRFPPHDRIDSVVEAEFVEPMFYFCLGNSQHIHDKTEFYPQESLGTPHQLAPPAISIRLTSCDAQNTPAWSLPFPSIPTQAEFSSLPENETEVSYQSPCLSRRW
jgi:hypothetical protein